MKLARVLLAVLVLLAGAGIATSGVDRFTVPEQTIVGLEFPIPPGELVDLNVSKIKSPPEFWVSSSTAWKVLEFLRTQDGKISLVEKRTKAYDGGVFFAAGLQPRRLVVVASITHVYVVKDKEGKVTDFATRTNVLHGECVIGGGPGPDPGPPDPGPGPGPPDPQPEPSFPDGKFGLAKYVYRAAQVEVAQDIRGKGAQALSTSFRGIAAKIAAGTLDGAENILAQTKAANESALAAAGVSKDGWAGWGGALKNKLVELDRAGKLSAKTDYQAAWGEIADGLSKVK